jgi:hypothetical protein
MIVLCHVWSQLFVCSYVLVSEFFWLLGAFQKDSPVILYLHYFYFVQNISFSSAYYKSICNVAMP